jgi:hypothetical protein
MIIRFIAMAVDLPPTGGASRQMVLVMGSVKDAEAGQARKVEGQSRKYVRLRARRKSPNGIRNHHSD